MYFISSALVCNNIWNISITWKISSVSDTFFPFGPNHISIYQSLKFSMTKMEMKDICEVGKLHCSHTIMILYKVVHLKKYATSWCKLVIHTRYGNHMQIIYLLLDSKVVTPEFQTNEILYSERLCIKLLFWKWY
jgi:hypothetical protein